MHRQFPYAWTHDLPFMQSYLHREICAKVICAVVQQPVVLCIEIKAQLERIDACEVHGLLLRIAPSVGVDMVTHLILPVNSTINERMRRHGDIVT